MKCNNEEKFFCKNCNQFLCEICKVKHSTSVKNIIDIGSFNTFIKKEIELTKDEITTNYYKFEKIDNLEKKLGILNIFNSLNDLCCQLKLIQETALSNSLENKLSYINNSFPMIKDNSYLLSKNRIQMLSTYIKLNEVKANIELVSMISDKIQKLFEDKEIFLIDLNNILFINNNNVNNKFADTTLNLSNFNIEPFEEDRQIKSLNADKLHNLVKLNDLEEKVRLLSNENLKLIEINEKYSRELKQLGLSQNKLLENNDYLKKELSQRDTIVKSDEELIVESININEIKDLIMEKKENILSTVISGVIENKLNQSYYDDLDQICLLSYLRTSTKQILEKLKLSELYLENYTEIRQIQEYFMGYFESFKLSGIYKDISFKISEKLYNYYFSLILDNKSIITNAIIDNFSLNYVYRSKKFKSQKNIDLKSCQITDNDISKLQGIIQNSVKLTDIFLQNNEITDKGFSALLPIIFSNKSIKNLYIDNNKLTDNSLKNLSSFIKTIDLKQVSLKVLSMQNNNLVEKGKDILKSIKLVLKVLIYI